MALTILHQRWDVSAPEEADALQRALPEDDDGRPPACLSRRHVRQPRAVVVYEVWDDERAAGAELDRVRAEVGAGPDVPQRAAFTVPDYFAAGFGRWRGTHRAQPADAAPAAVPAPREPEETPVAEPAS